MSATQMNERAVEAYQRLLEWVAEAPPGGIGSRGGLSIDDFGPRDGNDRGRFVAVANRGVVGSARGSVVAVADTASDVLILLDAKVQAGDVLSAPMPRSAA